MTPELLKQHLDEMMLVLSALSAVSAVIAVSWPYLQRDTLDERMKRVAREREALRKMERARLEAEGTKGSALSVDAPRDVYLALVERLGLARITDVEPAVELLRMAGMRGRAPLVTYLAARAISALVTPGFALFYLLIVMELSLDPLQLASAVAIPAAIGYSLPRLNLTNRVKKRQEALRRSWPDALDLLLISVEAGMSIEAAFRKVAEEIGHDCPELAEELSLTTAELSYLADRQKAYENLGTRTGIDSIKSTVVGLVQSETYGTSLGQTLRVLAKESRDFRMNAAEKKAASLPPKLTVPMILFFLPVLFAVIGAPAAIEALETWQ